MQEQSFEQLLNESFKEIYPGEVVTGTVIGVHEDSVELNIGYKADGIIKREDWSKNQNIDLRTKVNVGDTIEVKVKKLNDGEGQVVLSRRDLVKDSLNKRLQELFASKNVQRGEVIDINQGGLVVEIEPEVTVFMPKSLISNKKDEDINTYKGKTVEFVISEFNPIKGRCIADRKRLLIEEEQKKRSEVLSKIKVGTIVDGTIKSVMDYGAFVDIGGIDGLLHITEMGWGKTKNPKKVFNVGDKIKVLIREVNGSKISLTAKFPEENPWLKARSEYAIGKTVKGKVVRMTDYGAFVELDENIDALLHISEISRERIKKPSDVLKVGEEIEALVIDYNEQEKRISLSMKALLPELEKEEEKDVEDVDIESYAKNVESNNE